MQYFSVAADAFGILLCLIACLILTVSRIPERKTKIYFYHIFSSLTLALTSNMVGLIFKGQVSGGIHTVLCVSNFCEYFFGYILTFVLSQYFLYIIGGTEGSLLRWRSAFVGVLAVSVLLLVVSQFNGMYYYIDADSLYHRGALFWVSQMFAFLALVLSALLIFTYRKKLSRKEFAAFFSYIAFPSLALILQIFIYGLYLMLLFSTLSAVIMLLIIISDQADKYMAREADLADMRCDIMLSQIQPHFLYNSLTAICRLCDIDPKLAKSSLQDFTKYLRGNLDSLKQKRCVTFSEELRHTKAYLSLEKMRYGDALGIVYDINTPEFFIPPLTVEPLVENAVSHGLSGLPDGGQVTISSEESGDCFIIRVTDNGVGYDTSKPPGGERSHIGIASVRSRLGMMCGGTLEISSMPGQGTTAVIKIPKGEST